MRVVNEAWHLGLLQEWRQRLCGVPMLNDVD